MFGLPFIPVVAGMSILAVLFIMTVLAKLFRKAGPHEALIIYGLRGTRIVKGALRRRSEQLGGTVKPIELDENGPGLFGAAPANRRERSFDVAAADIGRNPDCRFEAHSKFPRVLPREHTGDTVSITEATKTRLRLGISLRPKSRLFGQDCATSLAARAYSSGRPVIAASSRTTRSDARPVIGSLRSRSNFSIAVWVSASTMPLGLIWP